jgi:two-component system cell cycle sensor histidine kinase/response regulator CckA
MKPLFDEFATSRQRATMVPWPIIGGLLAVAATLELGERLFSDFMAPEFRAVYALTYGLMIAAWFVLLLLRAPLPRSYWHALGALVILLLAVYASLLVGVPDRIGDAVTGESGAYLSRLWVRITGWLIGIGLAAALTLAVYELEQFNLVMRRQSDDLRESRDTLEERVHARTRELAESETRFRTLADAIPDIVARFDRHGRHVYVNQAVTAVTGLPREAFLGKSNAELGFPDELLSVWTAEHDRVFETGETGEIFFRYDGGAGTREMHGILVPEKNPSGDVEHIVVVTRDITELRKAERQAELLARFAREARDIVVVTDDTGRVEWVNEGFTRVTEYTLEEVLGRKLGSILRGPDTDTATAKAISDAVKARRPFLGQIVNYTKSGKPFWMELNIQHLPAAEGEPPRFVSVQRDITSRIRAEEAVAESESRYRLLAESSPDSIFIIDTNGQYHFANAAVGHNFQRPVEEIAGMNERELSPPEVAERQIAAVRRASVSDSPLRFEGPAEMPAGHRWFETMLTRLPHTGDGPVQVLGIARDITEQREADRTRAAIEERVRQAQKLESMALLAGGVAHDFNNLLMAVLGNASLLNEELPAGSPLQEMAGDIMVSAERAAELSRQMLAFSGHGRMVSQPINLSGTVEEMATLIEASIGHRVAPRYELAAEMPLVDADTGQVRQAVLSLVTNAVEAIEGRPNPSVAIRTGVQYCDHAFLDQHFAGQELPEGRYVFIEVEDNGTGISPEQLDRIFEPFFTTKFTGRGLGLSAVQGIMRGHHGTIAVRSAPGKGTAARLLFPEAASVRPDEAPVLEGGAWQAAGAVLVADDEASVRRAVRRMLERAGLEVVTASDGLQALRICEEYNGKLICVLLDTLMPRLDGEETLRELRTRYPDLPVVMISGYSPEYVRERFQDHGIAGVIQKPFQPEHLETTLRAIIDDTSETG